jgi:hypothetical protein
VAGRMTLHFQGIGQAMALPGIRQAIEREARTLAARAQGLSNAEGVDARVTTATGSRPGGRPFARVISDAAEAEFGTGKTARRRVLGRAAEQGG